MGLERTGAGWGPPWLRVGLTVGFCGGFTTLSTFSWQTLVLLEASRWSAAAVNIGLTVSGGLLVAFFGFWMVTTRQ